MGSSQLLLGPVSSRPTLTSTSAWTKVGIQERSPSKPLMTSAATLPRNAGRRRRTMKGKRSPLSFCIPAQRSPCLQFATAVSIRAALTLWYRNLRPSESVVEWRVDEAGTWYFRCPLFPSECLILLPSHGLPTRSRIVSEFMIGLEKMKAKAGEVSNSARALSLDDMHRLYNRCTNVDSIGERRWGTVRFVS